jgi:hypothetical protein
MTGRGKRMRADPAADLDLLARAVREAGFECVRRGDGGLLRVRVWHPALPGFGESVSTVPGPGGMQPWFRCSSGTLLAPCGDPAGAAAHVVRLLAPFVPPPGTGEAIGTGEAVTSLTPGAGGQAGSPPAARGFAGRRRMVSSA